MRALFAALFAVFAALWCAHAQAVTCTSSGGNWASAGIWDCGHVPANGDDVVIAQDTSLNTNSNTLNSLRIDNTLTIGNNATGRTLTVTGNITVNGSLVLNSVAATHSLVAGGDITNSGTVNLRPSANRLCNVTFNRNGNQTVSGSGSYTFNLITLNMGASRSNILDMQSAISVPSPFLTITNGTYKHSSATSITPWTADPSIPATGGFWLNSAATVTTSGFNVTVNGGMLRIGSGTMNVGTADGIRIILANSATTLLQMDGGALTVSGGITSASTTAAGTFTMSGGTMTLQTVDAGPQYTLLLGSATTLNWSGGTIVAVNGNNTTDDIDIRSGTQNVTGGTLQIGSNTATSTNQVSYINGAGGQLNVWDLVIGGTGGNQTISWRSSTNVLDDLTIQSGNTLVPTSGFAINVGAGNSSGDWINNGTFTPSTTTVTFTGTSNNQVIGGSTATTFYNLAFNKAANDVTLNTNATASNTLTFTSGDVITGANVLISTGNCTSLVTRTSGHVIGNLRLTFPSTNPATCTFHVGDANNYAPISITKTGSNSGTLTGSTTAGDHADTTAGTSGINASLSANRYWTLTAGTLATGTPYAATFQFCAAVGTNCAVNDVDSGANTSNFVVAKKTSGTWSLPTVGTRTGTSTQATGVATFGEFAVGQTGIASVAAANFECIDSTILPYPAASARHPLYTKLAGTSFTFDVVALNSSGGVETNYVGSSGTKSATVEIFDDSVTPRPACGAYPAARRVASQSITFSSTNAGRMAVSFLVSGAYKQLRCRVTDTAAVQGCSSDVFSIRPGAFAVSSVTNTVGSVTTPGATQTNSSGTPIIKAGSNFNLTLTSAPNYGNVPTLDTTKVVVVGSPTAGILSGTFDTNVISTGTVSGNGFTYSEVGNFGLNADAFLDSSFTSIDQGADQASSDCVLGSSTPSLSPTAKYGCNIGSNAVPLNVAASSSGGSGFGRFIPDHFVVAGSIVNRGDLSCSPASTFTYMGEPLSVTFSVTPMSGGSSPVKTTNYAGSYLKFSSSPPWTGTGLNSIGLWMSATGYPVGAGTCSVAFANATPYATSYSCTGVGAPASINRTTGPRVAIAANPASPTPLWTNAVGTFSPYVVLEKANSVDGPYNYLKVGVVPQDADGVTVLPGALDLDTDNDGSVDRQTVGSTILRYGRFHMANAFGSELLPLTMMAQSEYYNGTGWVLNNDDSCTAVSAPSTASLTSTPSGAKTDLTCGAAACSTSSLVSGGNLRLSLSPPYLPSSPGTSASGYADIQPSVPAWLQFPWFSSSADNPRARATFGIYKGNQRLIYRRERY